MSLLSFIRQESPLRYGAVIIPILTFSMAFASSPYEPKEIKEPSPGKTEVAKRLEFKRPFPPQPPLQDRVKAKGELNAVVIVNSDGTIQKITEITGSPTVIYAYKSYIQALQFVPALKSDVGPWIVTLHIVCSSTGIDSPIRTRMNINILNVQDQPATAN
jgi:hypothetical protein